ncbi:MAG: glutamate racemase [Candidatus Omnitrophica bacterium]|nr:glutamate racemase [Candidatus Omnitrophota bacterium]
MNKKDLPIGIFDSGAGGLTVLKEIKKILPSEDIVYLGDTAHLPYGAKSKSTIIKLSISNILFLLEKKVKLIIVACNSTSSVALPLIKNFFGVPILGVVEAGVEAVLDRKAKRIGIIGTSATIGSMSYQNLIKKRRPKAKIIAASCPLFVPLVEEGWVDSSVTELVAKTYLKGFKGKVDLLILGCTHYPLLKKVISKVLDKTELIDSAEEVATKTRDILKKSNLLKSKKRGKISFFLTDNSPVFPKLAELVLKRKFKPTVVSNI